MGKNIYKNNCFLFDLNFRNSDLEIMILYACTSSIGYNPKYWDKQAWTNSIDPDQMLQNVAFD